MLAWPVSHLFHQQIAASYRSAAHYAGQNLAWHDAAHERAAQLCVIG